ncbi:hypothetical protein KIPB_008638, partial [Kipferlia bialata]
ATLLTVGTSVEVPVVQSTVDLELTTTETTGTVLLGKVDATTPVHARGSTMVLGSSGASYNLEHIARDTDGNGALFSITGQDSSGDSNTGGSVVLAAGAAPGALTTGGSVTIRGGAGITTGDVNIGDSNTASVNIGAPAVLNDSVTANDTLEVTGVTTLHGGLSVDTVGITSIAGLDVSDGTITLSSDSGVQVSGAAGLTVTNDFAVSGDAGVTGKTTTGTFESGDATLTGTLGVSGAVTAGSTVDVTGVFTAVSTSTFKDDVDIETNLAVTTAINVPKVASDATLTLEAVNSVVIGKSTAATPVHALGGKMLLGDENDNDYLIEHNTTNGAGGSFKIVGQQSTLDDANGGSLYLTGGVAGADVVGTPLGGSVYVDGGQSDYLGGDVVIGSSNTNAVTIGELGTPATLSSFTADATAIGLSGTITAQYNSLNSVTIADGTVDVVSPSITLKDNSDTSVVSLTAAGVSIESNVGVEVDVDAGMSIKLGTAANEQLITLGNVDTASTVTMKAGATSSVKVDNDGVDITGDTTFDNFTLSASTMEVSGDATLNVAAVTGIDGNHLSVKAGSTDGTKGGNLTLEAGDGITDGFIYIGADNTSGVTLGASVTVDGGSITVTENTEISASVPTSGTGYSISVIAGDSTGGTDAGGDLFIDAGVAGGTGLDGTVNIGTTNAEKIVIGKTGQTIEVLGDMVFTTSVFEVEEINGDRILLDYGASGYISVEQATTANADGGDLTIRGGAPGTDGTGAGGDVTIVGGDSATGTDGSVNIGTTHTTDINIGSSGSQLSVDVATGAVTIDQTLDVTGTLKTDAIDSLLAAGTLTLGTSSSFLTVASTPTFEEDVTMTSLLSFKDATSATIKMDSVTTPAGAALTLAAGATNGATGGAMTISGGAGVTTGGAVSISGGAGATKGAVEIGATSTEVVTIGSTTDLPTVDIEASGDITLNSANTATLTLGSGAIALKGDLTYTSAANLSSTVSIGVDAPTVNVGTTSATSLNLGAAGTTTVVDGTLTIDAVPTIASSTLYLSSTAASTITAADRVAAADDMTIRAMGSSAAGAGGTLNLLGGSSDSAQSGGVLIDAGSTSTGTYGAVTIGSALTSVSVLAPTVFSETVGVSSTLTSDKIATDEYLNNAGTWAMMAHDTDRVVIADSNYSSVHVSTDSLTLGDTGSAFVISRPGVTGAVSYSTTIKGMTTDHLAGGDLNLTSGAGGTVGGDVVIATGSAGGDINIGTTNADSITIGSSTTLSTFDVSTSDGDITLSSHNASTSLTLGATNIDVEGSLVYATGGALQSTTGTLLVDAPTLNVGTSATALTLGGAAGAATLGVGSSTTAVTVDGSGITMTAVGGGISLETGVGDLAISSGTNTHSILTHTGGVVTLGHDEDTVIVGDTISIQGSGAAFSADTNGAVKIDSAASQALNIGTDNVSSAINVGQAGLPTIGLTAVAVNLTGAVGVTGATTLTGGLTVTDLALLQNGVTVSGAITTISDGITVAGGLAVTTGTAAITNALTAGSLTVSGASVLDTVTVNGALTTDAGITANTVGITSSAGLEVNAGAITLSSAAGVDVSNALTASSTLDVSGVTTLSTTNVGGVLSVTDSVGVPEVQATLGGDLVLTTMDADTTKSVIIGNVLATTPVHSRGKTMVLGENDATDGFTLKHISTSTVASVDFTVSGQSTTFSDAVGGDLILTGGASTFGTTTGGTVRIRGGDGDTDGDVILGDVTTASIILEAPVVMNDPITMNEALTVSAGHGVTLHGGLTADTTGITSAAGLVVSGGAITLSSAAGVQITGAAGLTVDENVTVSKDLTVT